MQRVISRCPPGRLRHAIEEQNSPGRRCLLPYLNAALSRRRRPESKAYRPDFQDDRSGRERRKRCLKARMLSLLPDLSKRKQYT